MKTFLKSLALASVLLGGYVLLTCAVENPENQTFPKGWVGGGKGYNIMLDQQTKRTGKSSVAIKFVTEDAKGGGFASVTQGVQPDNYRGKRIRLSGYIKTVDAGSASLWMRVDGKEQEKSLAFDNMMQGGRAVTGTQEWRKCEVVLDVSQEAQGIYFGTLLSGKGQSWTDDLRFEIVGNDVPVTNMTTPKEPVNLDFEN
jgi:hypothetical protein